MRAHRSQRRVVELALSQGWEYVPPYKGKHPRLVRPDGQKVVFAATPSCAHAARNMVSVLRRYGLVVPKGFRP